MLLVAKRAIPKLHVLNEAYDCDKTNSFSRGMRTDEHGVSVHSGDFRAQLRRTYQNITGLLEAQGATWHDTVVRSFCCGSRRLSLGNPP